MHAIPDYTPMTSSELLDIRAAWHPSTSPTWKQFTYRKVDLFDMYWVDCAHVIRDQSFDGRYYEDVHIPAAHEDFEPILSPMRMLELGIFGNSYFGSMKEDTIYPLGRERALLMPQNRPFDTYEAFDKPNWKTALFKRKASSTREWWMERDLIADCDPLGQFEWYCWYWLGRRIPAEDNHQVKRWLNFRKRQSAMLESNRAVGLQQALLHWSCDAWVHL